MSDTILVKSVEAIYPEWTAKECRIYDGESEVEKVVSRQDNGGTSYIIWWVSGEWRHAIGSDSLSVVWVDGDEPAAETGARGDVSPLDTNISQSSIEIWPKMFRARATAPEWADLYNEQAKHDMLDILDVVATLQAQLAAAQAAKVAVAEIANDYRDQIWVHQGTLRVLKSWLHKEDGFSAEDGFTEASILGMVERDLEASEAMDTRTLRSASE